jgi:predicted dienelactone hydrolase
MRLLFIALALLLAMPAAARSEDGPFQAGVVRIAADVPFEALIWYPTEAEGPPWQVGPFLLPASHGAKLAAGLFPILLLSHGGGESGGSPLILSGLSAALARHGFIVVAPFHGTAGLSLRPLQIHLALDAVLDAPRFRPHVDPGRLGMLGFSLGGAVTL